MLTFCQNPIFFLDKTLIRHPIFDINEHSSCAVGLYVPSPVHMDFGGESGYHRLCFVLSMQSFRLCTYSSTPILKNLGGEAGDMREYDLIR